jgi:long-subunit acyl-CoA synthetase (AMP-forming)
VQIDENDVYFSFLPLAHIFDRVAEEMLVFSGGSIGFWQGVCLRPIIDFRPLVHQHIF